MIFPGAAEAKAYAFIQRDMEANPMLLGIYREGLNRFAAQAFQMYRRPLPELNGEQLYGLLKSQEQTDFFRFVRDHTLEGVFSDPIYGGNDQAYGWRLIGFEGSRFRTGAEINETPQHPKLYYSLDGIVYER